MSSSHGVCVERDWPLDVTATPATPLDSFQIFNGQRYDFNPQFLVLGVDATAAAHQLPFAMNLNPPPLGTIYAMAVNYPDPSISVFDWNAPVATPSVSRMGIVTVFRGVPQQPNAWEYAELDEERSGEGLTVHDAVLLIEHCMDELVGPSPLFEMYLYFW
ncbi:hypothetical protein SLS57_008092 [Botryosphaeria dothidea]